MGNPRINSSKLLNLFKILKENHNLDHIIRLEKYYCRCPFGLLHKIERSHSKLLFSESCLVPKKIQERRKWLCSIFIQGQMGIMRLLVQIIFQIFLPLNLKKIIFFSYHFHFPPAIIKMKYGIKINIRRR